jgi:hypothetical protein
MDRLASLKETLPVVLRNMSSGYCLVDYSCPSASGKWVTQEHAMHCTEGRLVVTRVPGQSTFHKTRALNAGARRALENGADYLCFLDADTLTDESFGDWVLSVIAPNRFLVCLRSRSLFGFLVVPSHDFVRLGGFDEAIRNYGGEDIEMRMRLYLLGGLEYVNAPTHLLRTVNHAERLRTLHYDVSDRQISNAKNLTYVKTRIREWTGRELETLETNVRRLYRVDMHDRFPPGPSLTSPFEGVTLAGTHRNI